METAPLLERVTQSKFHSNFCILAGQRVKQINCFILGQPVYSSQSDDLLEYWFQSFSGKIPSVVFSTTTPTTRGAAEPGKAAPATHLMVPGLPCTKGQATPTFPGGCSPTTEGTEALGFAQQCPSPAAAPGKCSPSPQRDVPGTALRNTLPFTAQAPAVVCTFLSASTMVTADF